MAVAVAVAVAVSGGGAVAVAGLTKRFFDHIQKDFLINIWAVCRTDELISQSQMVVRSVIICQNGLLDRLVDQRFLKGDL